MPDLKAATDRLSERVEQLVQSTTVADLQSKRTHLLIRICVGLIIVCIAGIIATSVLFFQVQATAAQNKDNQVVNCQNANESRSANLSLWTFLISQSKAKTDQEKLALEKLRSYVTTLYQQHDCSQLDKKYPLPEPPDLGLNKSTSAS